MMTLIRMWYISSHNTCKMQTEKQHSEKVHFQIELEPLCLPQKILSRCSIELVQPFEDLTDYISTLIPAVFKNEKGFEIWAKKEQNVLLTTDNFTKCLNVFHHNGRRVDLLVREVNPELEKQKVQRYPELIQEQGAVTVAQQQDHFPDVRQVITLNRAPIQLVPKLIQQQTYKEYCETEQEQIIIFKFLCPTRKSFFQRKEGEFDRVWLLKQLDLIHETSIPYQ